MKALVVCPADRPEVVVLARQRPLALVPVLGRSLLDLTLADLAQRGAKEVLILAADRPELVRAAVGRGEAWGIQVEVLPETRELTADTARRKYRPTEAVDWLPPPNDVVVLDHLPGSPGPSLLSGYAAWFGQLCDQMPKAVAHRLGAREVSPGVFIGRQTRIAPTARLVAPCWVGEHSSVGAGAVIGPRAIVEGGAYVDEAAVVVESVVGPDTYIGALTELRNSLAWGQALLNWHTGSFTVVTDEILLADLGRRTWVPSKGSWMGRLLALGVLLATSPILLLALLRRSATEPLLQRREAVRTPWEVPESDSSRTVSYRELNGMTGLARRWPELYKIVQGEFKWIGNRPLTPGQAAGLTGEFERLWLAVPTGLFSLADIEGCQDRFGDEARAHASFYAMHPSRRGDLRLLGRMIARAFSGTA